MNVPGIYVIYPTDQFNIHSAGVNTASKPITHKITSNECSPNNIGQIVIFHILAVL
jgi:hypothetical protein